VSSEDIDFMELTAIDAETAVNSNSQSDRSRHSWQWTFPWLFVALLYTKETENHELDNNQSEGEHGNAEDIFSIAAIKHRGW